MIMHSLRRIVGAVVLATALAAPVLAAAPAMDAATEAKLKTLLDSAERKPANKARDPQRHPLETLKFFGLRQDMAILEVSPGGAGWWREFLEPLMAEKGKYHGAAFKPASEPVPPSSVDMVLTFRNVHNWMGSDTAKGMFDVMYKSLKPGGYLGVKEHRGLTTVEQDPKAKSGYVREDYAIALIESAGFKLVSKSEVNANPKDTKDYPKGVWTLPPNYAEGDKDRAKYTAIGESDRFTLLFQKPAN
jgi:predicted methyltransferase